MKSPILWIFNFLIFTFSLHAQKEIYPNSPEFDFSKIRPFQAAYSQMQYDLKVLCTLSPDESVFNITMIMPDGSNLNRLLTDVMGMNAKNGDFIYRNFSLLHPQKTNFRVEQKNNRILVEKQSMQENSIDSIKVDPKGVFDGTFAFWLMGAIDFSKAKSFQMNTWKTVTKGVEASLSSKVQVQGKVEINAGGKKFNCYKLSQSLSEGQKIVSYIAPEAPYLIKQEYVKGEEKPMSILEFKHLY